MTTQFEFDAQGPWILKDPNAVLDYRLDWDAAGDSWLAGDTIATSAWTLDPGISQTSATNTTTTATVWLSGGTAGSEYRVTNRITTAGGRTEDRSFRVRVAER